MLEIFLALLAGILTIAAPCILPLLPILLGDALGQRSKARPLFIVTGFVLIFSASGVLLSWLIHHTGIGANTVRTGAIVLLALFGGLMIWPEPFELLTSHLNRLFTGANRMTRNIGQGKSGGLVLGMTLGIVWTPCAGPVLGAILTLIAAQKTLGVATILLVAYAIGAAVPMLLISYGGQYLSGKIAALARYAGLLRQIFGGLIVALAIAMYFNYDIKLYSLILKHYPSFNPGF